MKIKNLSGITLDFPTGQTLSPGKSIFIADETWAQLLNSDTVKSWLSAGILELNGVIPLSGLPGLSTCPLPDGLGWDMDKYGLSIGYLQLNGQRKGVVQGFTPWTSTPYSQCRNGNQYYVDPVAGNDTTGNGSAGNPYKYRDRAVTAANAAGQPATIWVKATAQMGRTTGGVWAVVPTVPICFMAWGGTVISGAFADYTWVADGTYNWLFRATRTLVSSIYDKTQFDRFGNFVMYRQVGTLLDCSRTPGSWFQDTTQVVVNPFLAGVAPTAANIMVSVQTTGNNSGMEWTFGANPQHIFIDRETEGDGWEFRGCRLKILSSGYGAEAKIMAKRGVSVKYAGFVNADTQNGIQVDNWWGIDWNEDCYVGRAGYDSINRHNTFGTKPMFAMDLNVRAEDCGVFAPTVGSQNNNTSHENVIQIDVAGEYNYSRGGNLRNIDTTKTLTHGSRFRGDRGDIDVTGGTLTGAEINTLGNAQMWVSEADIEPAHGAFSIKSDSAYPILTRGMPAVKGKTKNVSKW